ncbi:helix-turn-helix domain-containing protein [Gimesia algae]|uniref:Chromosomal replication initiator protein DnaA n=1 Tax=Gimesia algae TaxID=2527971 RepID=A0A517V5V5_9PLAN|nr:DnaA/Hda family protein [Gimesia algae]QDT88385.1 Chromosomal replication initiator protein DnaA [Gimesia algae]
MMSKSQQTATVRPFKIFTEYQYAFTAVSRLMQTTDVPDPQLVYIYGPSGCGKSALINSLIPDYVDLHPDTEWNSMTASEFAAKYAVASKNKRIATFQDQLRDLKLLILEDVHSLENRPHTQGELLSTLDAILKQGGAAIITSIKPPGELMQFQKKLINRFHGGVCVGISPLKYQSRLELLKFWADFEQIPVKEKELSLIARQKECSPRELSAILNQLHTVSRIQQNRIDGHFVKDFLAGNLDPPRTSTAKITRVVCREFKTSLAQIRSANRSQQIVLPRQCAMFLSRELTAESLANIANYFNRKNHSTVIHACRQIQNDLEKSPGLRQQLSRIKQQLGVYPL